jgi:hypothetical protein
MQVTEEAVIVGSACGGKFSTTAGGSRFPGIFPHNINRIRASAKIDFADTSIFITLLYR